MRTKTGSKILKILCIAAVLVLMLALCGCRTRITNNNEVNNVMYDDGGFMQDEYDTRREELDLSTAKKPVFTGFGNSEEDAEDYENYEYSDDSQTLEDYEPSEEEEVDDSNPPVANNTGTSNSNSTVKNRVVKRTTTTILTVTLNPNGGKCKTKTIAVRNGGTYGVLPTPTRDDYTFSGWYTKKDNDKGKKVTSTTKVSATKNHTLYAHWTKKETEEKTEETKPTEEAKVYTVKFDLNASDATFKEGGGDLTIKDGETYGSLPTAERPKYKFKGWSTSSTGTSTVSSGDKVTESITLFAVWEEDQDYNYTFWTKELKESIPSKDSEKYRYKILGDDGGSFLQDSGMTKGSASDCDYLVYFGSKSDAKKKDNKTDNPDRKQIIVIPKEAIKGSTKNEAVLMYKLHLFDTLYSSGLDIGQAETDLGVSDLDDIEIIDSDYPDDSGGGDSGGDDSGGGSGNGGEGGDSGSGDSGSGSGDDSGGDSGSGDSGSGSGDDGEPEEVTEP